MNTYPGSGTTGKVALVTGASRGVGKGVALGLCEAGATVYITGRSDALADTPSEAQELGGQCIPLRCDHRNDGETEAVFEQVMQEMNRLDLLVNNMWGGYERMIEDGQFTWEWPFWQQPMWRWDAMFAAGVRAHYVASRLAARIMVAQRSGLIVTISFQAAHMYIGNVAYGVAKAADDKMVADMAHELREHNVAAVSLHPGLVRTELVMQSAEYLDMSNSESPQFVGRAVAALAGDTEIMRKSGKVLTTAQVADEYGFLDVDGKWIVH